LGGGRGFGEDVVEVGDEGGHVDLSTSAGCGGGGFDVVLDCGLVSMEVGCHEGDGRVMSWRRGVYLRIGSPLWMGWGSERVDFGDN
jgi:hypothetical protein